MQGKLPTSGRHIAAEGRSDTAEVPCQQPHQPQALPDAQHSNTQHQQHKRDEQQQPGGERTSEHDSPPPYQRLDSSTQFDDLLWLFAIQHRRVQQAASERLERIKAATKQHSQQAEVQSRSKQEGMGQLRNTCASESPQNKRARTEEPEHDVGNV